MNKENEIYFLERLYFSATNYFIFIAKVDFQNPWLSRGNGLPERVWRVWGLIRLKKKKKKRHHMPSLQSVLNQIWLDWGGTVAFPQAVIAILCTLNQVHFEWPKMKEHNQNSHKSVSTDFLFHWNFEGYYWKHYFECSVFKSQLFLSLLEVEFAHVLKLRSECSLYNWLIFLPSPHPAPLHLVS